MRKFLATRKASSKVGAPQLLHEITSLHFRAAAFPGDLRLLRHAVSHSDANAKTFPAPQANRTGETVAKSVPHSFPKARRLRPLETKVFSLSLRPRVSLFRFLCLSFPKILPKTVAQGHTRPQTRPRTRRR